MVTRIETRKNLHEKKITFLPDGKTISFASSNFTIGEITSRHNLLIDKILLE